MPAPGKKLTFTLQCKVGGGMLTECYRSDLENTWLEVNRTTGEYG